MRLKRLIGAGDRITLFTLPFALAGVATNPAWPSAGAEERGLAATFGDAYRAYRAKLLLPWL